MTSKAEHLNFYLRIRNIEDIFIAERLIKSGTIISLVHTILAGEAWFRERK